MKLSLLLSGLAAMSALAATDPPPNFKNHIEALKSDPVLNSLFAEISAALDKPASEIQQQTFNVLTSAEMAPVLALLSTEPNMETDGFARYTFNAAINAALAPGKKEQQGGEEGEEETAAKGEKEEQEEKE